MTADTQAPSDIDVLIVGSGPVGATYARCIAEDAPDLAVLMVEAGPALTAPSGAHVRSIENLEHQVRARMLSQGPMIDVPPEHMAWPGMGANVPRYRARPGTFLLVPEPDTEMPAAAMSACVGGMGIHWTCAVPRPRGSEMAPFIPTAEMEQALQRAERLVGAKSDLFGRGSGGDPLLDALARTLNPDLPEGCGVRPMPMAGAIGPGGDVDWSSTATVLGPLATGPKAGFHLVADTVCMKILMEGGEATGAVLRHRVTGEIRHVRARSVVVAADGLRTPQLLHASGIRSWALGRHINDHTIVSATVRVHDSLVAAGQDTAAMPAASYDWLPGTRGAFWIPFADTVHPFSGQVMEYAVVEADGRSDRRAGVTWYGTKDIRADDRIVFSTDRTDYLGLPAMNVRYGYSNLDQARIAQMHQWVDRTSQAIGTFINGDGPQLRPAGTSLHYQGTVRMGAVDDGTSVCNSHARLWSARNVFLGGNGVIPTATACNPTLTSMALAIRSASDVIEATRRAQADTRGAVA